ncbi:MAG: DedA family protein, partial [Marinovum sp.]|nr:DedA family protein [Marinovum sp.]
FEQIAHPILMSLGKADAVAEFAQRFNDVGVWTILTAGVTPFPFKVITIMSGATAMPLGLFVGTAFVARGLRFFAVALLLRLYGAAIRTFIERYLGWMFLLFILLFMGGILGTRFL